VETILNAMMSQSGVVPYVIVFTILLLCGFGLPVPEDIVLFAAGMMAFYQRADVYLMIAVCFAGVMMGDSTVYLIGSFYGKRLRRKAWVKRVLPPSRMRMVRRKLHEQGNKVIFAARFMPGLRTPVFFTSGTLHLPFRVFFFYDGLAALLSVPAIVYATFFFGDHVDKVISVVKRLQFGVVGTIVGIVAVLVLKAWWAHKKRVEMEIEAARESSE
jgi:membrane protein DedA with SNARE-associated domain